MQIRQAHAGLTNIPVWWDILMLAQAMLLLFYIILRGWCIVYYIWTLDPWLAHNCKITYILEVAIPGKYYIYRLQQIYSCVICECLSRIAIN